MIASNGRVAAAEAGRGPDTHRLLSSPWLPRLVLLALLLIAYANSLTGPFQFDDHGVVLRDAGAQSLTAYVRQLNSGLRPVLKLSYVLCWAFGGAPLAFHLFNLLVHVLNTELVLRLYDLSGAGHHDAHAAALRPQPRASALPSPGPLPAGAYLAGLLFAVHPIHTEAVTYISGRSSSLATTFVLLAFLFHSARARSIPAATRPKLWAWLQPAWAPLCFVAAVLTKETSAVLPIGLLLWDRLIERSSWRQALRRGLLYWLLGGSLFVLAVQNARYFALLYQVLGQRPLLESLHYQLGGLAYLAERLALLAPLCIDPGLWLKPPAGPIVMGTAATLFVLLGLSFWQAHKRPRLAFGLGWFLLCAFLPYVVLPRVDVINERHVYLANIGLFPALACLLSEIGSYLRSLSTRASPRYGAPWIRVATSLSLGALSAGLVAATWRRNQDYSSEVALWRSTVAAAPKNPRAQNNLGVAYESAARLPEASIAYTRALVLEPRYMAARQNMARVLRKSQVRSTQGSAMESPRR